MLSTGERRTRSILPVMIWISLDNRQGAVNIINLFLVWYREATENTEVFMQDTNFCI